MEIVLCKKKSVLYMYFEIFFAFHINKCGLHINTIVRVGEEGVYTTYEGFIMCLLDCSKMRNVKYGKVS